MSRMQMHQRLTSRVHAQELQEHRKSLLDSFHSRLLSSPQFRLPHEVRHQSGYT